MFIRKKLLTQKSGIDTNLKTNSIIKMFFCFIEIFLNFLAKGGENIQGVAKNHRASRKITASPHGNPEYAAAAIHDTMYEVQYKKNPKKKKR